MTHFQIHTSKLIILFSLIVLFGACGPKEHRDEHRTDDLQNSIVESPAIEITRALSFIQPTVGNTVSGTVIFTKASDGITVKVDITGLTPGKHGFHIHEFGDCSAPDGTSAGGHFDMDGHNHGAPGDVVRHAGDMGNLEANEAGEVHTEFVDKTITLNGAKSIIGRSLIIHAKEDDMKTQPTGNAGPRVACGVIGISKI